jgi:hypothetical protein
MAAKRKRPAKRTATPKPKRTKAKKTKAKANFLGGVARGIAWLGDKVRGAVARTKKKAKKKKATKKPPAKKTSTKRAKKPEPELVTINNPLP